MLPLIYLGLIRPAQNPAGTPGPPGPPGPEGAGLNTIVALNTFALLRAYSITDVQVAQGFPHVPQVGVAMGYSSMLDGGGKIFVFDLTSSAADDDATVIKPAGVSGVGRWRGFL